MTLLYSRRCFIDDKLVPANICIENAKITAIEIGSKNQQAWDLGDAVLMAGILDVHVHINEPGRSDWEGFDTATQAAAAGGICTLIEMPLNASPVTTTVKALQQKTQAATGKTHVNCGFYGGIVPDNLAELEGLIQAGVWGIKAFLVHSGIDEFPSVGEAELEAAMPLLAKYGLPLLAHCELLSEQHYDENLKNNTTSYAAYLQSRPKEWENEAVKMMIRLCRRHRCPVHIVHVSSAEALPLIAQARAEGLPITAETCPHYLYFNAEDIPDANTLYKCAPPIRERENNEALKKALKTGLLQFIASDHSPAPPPIKELQTGNLLKAWGGIAGLQFLLPVAWTALREQMSLEQFIPLLTQQPAQFVGLQNSKGSLKVNTDADLTAWLPEEQFTVESQQVLFRHKTSPYIGQQLWGRVQQTFVGGELVYDGKAICASNKGSVIYKRDF